MEVRQVEDNIVYDDERDLDKSTFTESLRITFKNNGKVSIKETPDRSRGHQ